MAPDTNTIHAGSIVEIWNRSLGHFGGQFQVEEETPEGIRVHPVSEVTPLPVTFTRDEVRLLQ